MMIRVDENHDITCVNPKNTIEDVEDGLYLVDDSDVTPEIRNDLFSYKYIDRKFVKKTDINDDRLATAKAVKIQFLNDTCKRVIYEGITWNGEHYSLTEDDQINLSKLASQAAMYPQMPIFYHPDGGLCRQYTPEEILDLAQTCVAWVTYHTTYFNFAKAFINSLNDFDQIIGFDYGSTITDPELSTMMVSIIESTGITYDTTIHDPYDYEAIQQPTKRFFEEFWMNHKRV